MAAGDLIQLGTSVVVGFNGRTIGTAIMESSGEEAQADIKEIRGPQNAVVTKLITNPRKAYNATGVLLSADLTTFASAKPGDTLSINSVKTMLVSAPLVFGTQEAKISVQTVKEDSMTYT